MATSILSLLRGPLLDISVQLPRRCPPLRTFGHFCPPLRCSKLGVLVWPDFGDRKTMVDVPLVGLCHVALFDPSKEAAGGVHDKGLPLFLL